MTRQHTRTLRNLLVASTALGSIVAIDIGEAFAQTNTIVVTARKREENIQDVPVSVSAISSDAIERGNYVGVEDIAQFVPGFEFDRSFQRSFERPVIRGKSVILTTTENPTSVFINGAFFAGTLSSIDLSEVERIEIIKGPQSALYGRATYAGAINVITKLPGDEFTAKVSGTAAEDDQFEVTAGVSGPIVSDIFSAGIYLRHYEFGGQWQSVIDGRDLGEEESQSIAATFVLNPTDNIEIVGRVIYDERDDGAVATNFHPHALNNSVLRLPDRFDYFDGDLTLQPFVNNNSIASLFGDVGEKQDHIGGSIQVNWDLNDAFKLVSNTSYDDFDTRFVLGPHEANGGYAFVAAFPLGPAINTGSIGVIGAPVSDFIVNDMENLQTFSQDLRLEYDNGGRLSGLIGGYYFDRDEDAVGLPRIFSSAVASISSAQDAAILSAFQNASNIRGAEVCAAIPGCDPTTGDASMLFGGFPFNSGAAIAGAFPDDLGNQILSGTRNWAIYGRIEFDFTDTITGSFEGRYAQDKKTITSFDFGPGPVANTVPILDAEETFSSFTPRITLDWDVTDDTLLYFVAANGTKPGGFNGGPIAAVQGFQSFEEEKIWSYEVGAKNTLMDGQLILNIAGYFENIKDYQLTDILVDQTMTFNPPTETAIGNKGKVQAYGVELDVVYSPEQIEGLTFNLGYAFSENEFKGGSTDSVEGQILDVLDNGALDCSLGSIDPLGGCVPTPGSIDGRRTPLSSKHQLNGGFNLTRPLNDQIDWFVQVDASYEGKKFVQVMNRAIIPSSVLVNASIGIQNENLRFSFWGKNLTNDDAVTSGTRFIEVNRFFRRAFLTFPQRERQFGGTVTLTY